MSSADQRPLPVWVWFALGVAGAVAGLLPWLVTGARLPLQNLAEDQTTTDTPIALLPFSQYSLGTIVALLVVGGAIAGVTARALRGRRPALGLSALVAGVLAVQLVAAVQTTVVTVGLLEDSRRSALYTGVIVAVIVVSLLVSLLVLLLVARAPVPGATIALALAVVVSASWLGAALGDVLLLGPDDVVQAILFVMRWLPAVLMGCVIAWCGFRTTGRIAAVLVSLAALWIGPAFFTGISAAAGTRVLAPYPDEMAQYAVQVFGAALTAIEVALPPLVVALVIGVLGSLLLDRRRRRADDRPDDASATVADARR